VISRFTRLFKKTDLDEQRAFQLRVQGILKQLYPDRDFTITPEPLTLGCDGQTLGLTNLRSNFLLSSKTEADLRDLIKEQFDSIFSSTDYLDRDDIDWSEAEPLLMPQLMPVSFLEKMPLVNLPFSAEIVIGFVIDTEKAYSYVNEQQRVRWQVSTDAIRDTAFTNLRSRSQGIEMVAVPKPNGLFVVNTLDGFDAVRLLDEELQELVAEHIGSPFLAGIPNRDFLICWSKNDDRDFQGQMITQVSNDFDERPYPLSRVVFEIIPGREIAEVARPTDARASAADLN